METDLEEMETDLDRATTQVLVAIAVKLDMTNQRDYLWLKAALGDVIREALAPFLTPTPPERSAP